MSNVNLSIGGRTYTVACADGEEAHVTRLGSLIDEKVTQSGAIGQTESRMLLFAALLLADETDAARRKGAEAPTPEAPTPEVPTPPALPENLGERMQAIASRIENLANLLEGSVAKS